MTLTTPDTSDFIGPQSSFYNISVFVPNCLNFFQSSGICILCALGSGATGRGRVLVLEMVGRTSHLVEKLYVNLVE